MHNMPIASLTEHFLFAMAVVLPAPRRARPRAGPFTSARRLSACTGTVTLFTVGDPLDAPVFPPNALPRLRRRPVANYLSNRSASQAVPCKPWRPRR